tara:strand:- start:672 stop:1412 length:741 start_codon:yes stop_codon:yes gene_type:complete
MRFVSVILMMAGLVIAAPLQAAPFSAEQEKAIEKLIADYFVANPEKLGDALDSMQAHYQEKEQQRMAQTLEDSADALYRTASDFTLGPADAPITIVEFFDYNCGYCKRALAPLMQTLDENDDVRLVFKELPILSPDSRLAAKTALALDDPLTFLSYHTKLMTHKGSVNQTVIDKTLTDLKLSPKAIAKKSKSKDIAKAIEDTSELAERLGINGTPAFIINGSLYPGALEAADLATAIGKAREELTN